MPVEYKDYYKTLGVPKSASADAIRKAYRKLARQYHPDVNKQPGAEARFKAINEAHEVLGDPQKRRRYDELGANWQQYEQWQQQGGGRNFEWVFTGPGGARFGNGSTFEGADLGDFSDFFRTFFGDLGGVARGGRTSTRSSRRAEARAGASIGASLEQQVEISLEESFRGTERTLEIRDPDNGGTRRLVVKIPPGVRDGQRIRLSGQGQQGRGGGAAGDLYLVVRVKEHPFFRRDGDNIRAQLPVSLSEALLGAEVSVPTLKGRVRLRIPPETQNGRVIRLAGQGMPRLGDSGHGDMLVEVKVVLPQKLSDDERELVRKLTAARHEDVRSHLL
jgi:curved DNA-binding protein